MPQRPLLIRLALHDAVVDQCLEPAGEQVAGDAEVLRDVVEPVPVRCRVTRTNALETLVIASLVRRLSTRDVEGALADALEPEAGLSRTTVSTICRAIIAEIGHVSCGVPVDVFDAAWVGTRLAASYGLPDDQGWWGPPGVMTAARGASSGSSDASASTSLSTASCVGPASASRSRPPCVTSE